MLNYQKQLQIPNYFWIFSIIKELTIFLQEVNFLQGLGNIYLSLFLSNIFKVVHKTFNLIQKESKHDFQKLHCWCRYTLCNGLQILDKGNSKSCHFGYKSNSCIKTCNSLQPNSNSLEKNDDYSNIEQLLCDMLTMTRLQIIIKNFET